MIQVYVETITNRVKYAFDFIFSERGIGYELIDDVKSIQKGAVLLNYSNQMIGEEVYIKSSQLLFSDTIRLADSEFHVFDSIRSFSFDNTPDPVASLFYVLTRMEEYVNETKDKHGRFPFTSSVLHDSQQVQFAYCDRIAVFICNDLLGLDWKNDSPFKLIPSFDIDNSFAYKYKKGGRRFLSVARDISKLDLKRIKERKSVRKGERDPYDTFDKISDVAKRFPETIVFWLTASEGKFDRNLSIDTREHQELIRKMSNSVRLGIHPSYDSFLNASKIKNEIGRLNSIANRGVNQSRQHFLRMKIPQSYRVLLESGIEHDYTMGFAEHYGFRCGTARVHKWFDLERNEITALNVHPFIYMDGTINEYMNLGIDEAKHVIRELYQEVRAYGGDFICIWHNETIGGYGKWSGWQEVLEYTLDISNE